jgi:primosomal protein N' (replication factor Y)
VELEAGRLFPGSRILRMDTDSTSTRGAHEKIFHEFLTGGADILVGTQMVAKGLEFPEVTLVGVVDADTMLNLPDFRARERTFQLLTQVAGRTGRGLHAGEVVIQTFNPTEVSVIAASRHDFEGFFRVEIKKRHLLGYPPYSHLIRILLTGNTEEKVIEEIRVLGTLAQQEIIAYSSARIELLGPAPALIPRLKNKYRWQIIVKGNNLEIIRRVVDAAVSSFIQKQASKSAVNVNLDVDPLGMW